jgi:hypothetical protein
VLIVVFDKFADLAFEIWDGLERAATDGALRDQPEPTLHLIEPRGVSGSEVNVEAQTASEPSLDASVPVSAVVIDDQMHLQLRRDIRFNVAQEAEKLLMAVARFALGEDLPVGDIQSGKERRGPMADVIVRDPLDVSEPHGSTG